jgi:alcohol dehydrogenase
MSSRIYQLMMPKLIRFGTGSLRTLSDELNQWGTKTALVVTDPGIEKAGLIEPVKEQLSIAGVSVDVCNEAEPEPTLPGLDAIADKFNKRRFDVLVGVGGGSSIDTAKGLSILLTHGGKGADYLGIGNIPGPCIPVIAIPTTAGTGSEATNIAIFGDTGRQLKMGIVSPYIFARLSIVDPILSYGCPANVTAASGLDTLVHAIECYTGKKANIFTDALALEAISLVAGNLRTAVADGSNEEARKNMSEAALLGGITIVNSGVTAVHALAYPLGARFHVTHGVANSLLLPYVMEYNFSSNLYKFAMIAGMLGEETEGLSLREAAERSIVAVKDLSIDVGVPQRLRDLSVPKDALEGMAVATMDITRLMSNNPRALTLDDVRNIWKNAW